MAKRDPVYWNAGALVLNSAAASALGFLFWMVAARRLSPEDVGFGAAVVSAATLAALIGKAGFDAAVIRFGPSAGDRLMRKLLLHAAVATVVLTALVVGVILALAEGGVASLAPLLSPTAAGGFLLLACATSAAWILDAFFIAEQAATWTLARNVAFNVVKLVVPLVLVVPVAAFAVPLAWGVGLAASILVALAAVPLAMRARRVLVTEKPSRRDVAVYAAKNYVLNVSEFLPGLVLPILVLETLGPAVNARFFLAWTIATVGFLASKAIMQSAFAALVRKGDPRVALGKAARLSALLLLPFALGLVLLAGPLLRVFGPGYADAALQLRLLALSIPAVVVTNALLAYLKARRPGWELTLLPAATLVAFLAAAPLALALGGTTGIALVWLAVQLLAGAYAALRLTAILWREPHATASLRRSAHEG